MKNWLKNAVDAGTAQLKSSVWNSNKDEGPGPPKVPKPEGPSVAARPSPASSVPANPADKQYLRLPVESARKLRWYDKNDLTALTRVHLREKRELQEGMTALKKMLLRQGVSESDMDMELKAVLAHAEDVKDSDEGVASVLLTACMAELESVQEQQAELQQQVTQLTFRLQQYESGALDTSTSALFSISGDDASPFKASHAAAMGQAMASSLPVQLVEDLNSALQACEDAFSTANAASRRLRNTELEVSAAELSAALSATTSDTLQGSHWQPAEGSKLDSGDQQDVQDGWAHDSGLAPSLSSSGMLAGPPEGRSESFAAHNSAQHGQLLAKLQRLEVERRELEEATADMAAQLAAARAAADKAAALAESAALAQEQASNLRAALDVAQTDLAAARAAAKAAEELAEKRGGDLRRLQHVQQGAEAMGRLQDGLAEAEERAAEAVRRMALMDARCAKAEAALKDKSRQLQQLQAENASLASQLQSAQAAASEASATTASTSGQQQAGPLPPTTPAARTGSKASLMGIGGSSGSINSTASENLSGDKSAAASMAKDLAASRLTVSQLEARLQAADAREARLMAEVREAERVLAERERLAAEVVALRDKLAEGRADSNMAAHYKQMCAELTQSKEHLQEELLVTAQLVTQLDTKLRGALQRADAGEAAMQLAEQRAHAAEAAISNEVDKQLAAAASSRAMWPVPAREEVSRLEGRVAVLTSSLSACQQQLQEQTERVQAMQQKQADLQAHLQATEEEMRHQQTQATAQLEELTATLQATQRAADDAERALQRAEAERARAIALSQHAAQAFTSQPPGMSGGSRKWQVQNSVGGGSLYGVADIQDTQHGGFGPGRMHSGLPHVPSHGSLTSAPRGPFTTAFLEQHHQQLPQPPQRDVGAGLSRASSINSACASSVQGNSNGAYGGSSEIEVLHDQGGPGSVRYAASTLSARASRNLDAVDVVYLKNVVLKFLEAAMAGRVAERDSLLPAVAALLQATPAEFQVLRKVAAATAPPAAQMLTALGRGLGLT